ncbi:MAG: ISLre2 family transposase, partial [Cyanobacteria bacterium J06633_2]
ALRIGDIGNWDGETLREREASIRQTSLVLAGQCVALLIHRLVQHPSAHQEASERTTSMRHAGGIGVGRQWIRVTTIANVMLNLRLPYIRGASKKRRKGRRVGQRGTGIKGGYYPFLEWLGMGEHVTPLVWTTVAQMGMLSSSFVQARDGLNEWGIRLSEGRVQRLVYRFGEAGESIRQGYIEQMRAGDLATGDWLRHCKAVISVDGGRTRVRHNKKRGKRLASGRRGYSGKWREPKLLTIYAVDEKGKRVNSVKVPLTNDGTMASVEGFMELLEMHCVRLGLVHAQKVLLVADGAEWIWSRIPTMLKRLGVDPERVIELIDFYHATTYLYDFSDAAFSKKKEAKRWAKRACSQLKHGLLTPLIKRMNRLAQQVKSKKNRELAHSTLSYLSKQPHRFDYQRVALLKLPIGSGAIESLIRQVINLRLKSTGKFWLRHHAELMLLGRCQWAAGRWEGFCSDILQSKLSDKSVDNLTSLHPAPLAAA